MLTILILKDCKTGGDILSAGIKMCDIFISKYYRCFKLMINVQNVISDRWFLAPNIMKMKLIKFKFLRLNCYFFSLTCTILFLINSHSLYMCLLTQIS